MKTCVCFRLANFLLLAMAGASVGIVFSQGPTNWVNIFESHVHKSFKVR